MKPVKPCFPYPGGKSRFLKYILPLIPDHKSYIEPFAGGLAVLLAKGRSACEVINDLDGDITNFYRYVRFHKDVLLGEFRRYFNSRSDFELMLENPGYTDLQRAVRWYLLKVNSFGAMSNHWGRSKNRYHGYDRLRHEALISAVSDRLQRVFIEQGDWCRVVDFYDSPKSFIFFDPPYVSASKTAYAPFSEFEMQRLRNRLDTLKGRFVLTCDDSPQCRDIFKDYPLRQLSIKYSTSNGATGPKATSHELLIMSPEIAASNQAILKAA